MNAIKPNISGGGYERIGLKNFNARCAGLEILGKRMVPCWVPLRSTQPMLYKSVMRRGGCKTTKKDGSGFGVASILSTFRDMGYVIDPINEPIVGFGYEITMKIETDLEKHVYMDITTGETVGN